MDTSKMIAPKEDITFKNIVFKSGDKQHSYETNGANVIVVGSTGSHDHGSSKIKLKNIVDYKWEVKNYVGRLIAIHIGGKYVAYAIKVCGKDGKIEGMVRVVNPVTGQRALIRGKSSEVLDLQFAHMKSQILLASIEDIALHIHSIEVVGDKIICTLVLKIDDPIAGHIPKYDKINWCPYVPENESESDNSIGQLLVWTRDTSYQCYSMNSVVETYGTGAHRAADITEGTLKHQETSEITGATLSPDGTTLAITFEDGGIRFYQVYFHINEDTPRLLHQWIPHDGKPVSSLFFLDDHSKFGAGNSLWKYAITTSDNNTEIKVWCCATWQCTQTIRFKSAEESELFFQAEIDPTSSYLLLTETKNRGLYVLQILQTGDDENKVESEGSKSSSDEEQNGLVSGESKAMAFIKSITEFPLSSPILSFGIVDATVRKYKCAYNDVYLLDDLDDYDEDNLNRYCVVIHLFLVQPKSVQECHVLYQPSLSISAEVGSSVSALSEANTERQDDLANVINDLQSVILKSPKDEPVISGEANSSVTASEGLLESSLISSGNGSSTNINQKASPEMTETEKNLSQQSIHKPASTLNLMTPDSFHSSGKITPEGVSNEVYSTLRMLAGEKPIDSASLLHMVNNETIDNLEEKIKLLHQVSETGNESRNSNSSTAIVPPMPPPSTQTAGVSGGSSPSREVQEILSLKDSDCINDFYNDSIDIQDDTDGSANNADVADANDVDDEEKNINKDDDDTYILNNVKEAPLFENASGASGTELQSNGLSKSNKGDWPNAPVVTTLTNIKTSGNMFEKSTPSSPMNDINFKLDQLLETIQTQNCQISELRNEVLDLKKIRSNDTVAKVDANIHKIEVRLSKLIEEYLIRYEREHNKKLEAFLTGRESQSREIRDSVVLALTPVLCNQLTGQLSQILIAEIQKHFLPIVVGKLDGIKAQIQTDIAQKITMADHVIKDNIAKICKSKETLDVFGSSVAAGVKLGLQQTYVEALKSIILPAYEKANAELFKQLYDTFNKGTIAYSNQLTTYTKMYEPIHTELVNFMRSVPEQLRVLSDATVTTCTQRVSNDINKDLKVMQTNLLKTLKENIKSEIKKGFETQAATLEDSVIMAVRSQAQTPAPSIFDVQEQIKQQLRQGQINKAFHQALLANDLNLVEYALERADYNQVFNPCPLEQTVLLSLIQQISADMSNHNELKQKYLSDAIINLNLRDAITKEHSPKVLKELLANCQNYVATNPHNALSSGVRMLIMAVQGFGINLI